MKKKGVYLFSFISNAQNILRCISPQRSILEQFPVCKLTYMVLCSEISILKKLFSARVFPKTVFLFWRSIDEFIPAASQCRYLHWALVKNSSPTTQHLLRNARDLVRGILLTEKTYLKTLISQINCLVDVCGTVRKTLPCVNVRVYSWGLL